MHLGCGAFEEATTASEEEGVAGEDSARLGWVGAVGDVVADGVSSVTRGSQTPALYGDE